MAKKKTAVLKPGAVVTWCGAGGKWTVVEWQPRNGINGSYWLKNSRGDSACAGRDEVTAVQAAK